MEVEALVSDIWGVLWKGMKVTRNQKGFISGEQAIEISWLPQMETRPIGQIKVTKGDLGSAAPDGAESSQGSGQGFPSLPLVPREPPSQASRLRSSSEGEGPVYQVTDRHFPWRPKVTPKEELLEWCPALSWDGWGSLPHPPLSEDKKQEGPWLGIQSRGPLVCDWGISGAVPARGAAKSFLQPRREDMRRKEKAEQPGGRG